MELDKQGLKVREKFIKKFLEEGTQEELNQIMYNKEKRSLINAMCQVIADTKEVLQ